MSSWFMDGLPHLMLCTSPQTLATNHQFTQFVVEEQFSSDHNHHQELVLLPREQTRTNMDHVMVILRSRYFLWIVFVVSFVVFLLKCQMHHQLVFRLEISDFRLRSTVLRELCYVIIIIIIVSSSITLR